MIWALDGEGRFRAALLVVLTMLLVLHGTVVLSTPAQAGETPTFRFQPDPLVVQGERRRTFTYDLREGETLTDGVRLTNKTGETRSFRVYGAEASRDEETGRISVAPYSTEPAGVGSWITTPTGPLEVGPRDSVVVPFTITRPDGTPGHGAGAIVAEEISTSDPSGGIEVLFRVAIVVEVGGEAGGLHAGEPRLELPVTLIPKDARVVASVTNDTLQRADVEVTHEIESLTGRRWKLEPVSVALGPGESVEVPQTWSTVPRWGSVAQVHTSISWEGGQATTSGGRQLVLPLWLLALAISAVGVRGIREMRTRRQDRLKGRVSGRAPGPDALRRRLIEAALGLHTAGQNAPPELREATAAEARAVAAEARRTEGARDIEHAARSLAVFASGLDDGGGSAQKAARDFDRWLREHRDDPRVKELVEA